MTSLSRHVCLLGLALSVLACGDDDDDTGSVGGAGNGGGAGAPSGQPLDWDAYCSQEKAQYEACPGAFYEGCATRCASPFYKKSSAQVATYQQCLLARGCDQLDSDDACYVAAAFPDQAQAESKLDTCKSLQTSCQEAGAPLFAGGDFCIVIYSQLVDPALNSAVQQCLASHQDCATTQACLQAPVADLKALADQEQACEEQLTGSK
ncbi:MAG: hypothetical protein EOO70_02710 [Myxococcaceae bacterium]|nr:MAG: hypothetical protein EOO70_02710 [Myxococcaceae bacterium]